MHGAPALAEEGGGLELGGAVGVDLDEDPLRAPLDVDVLLDPGGGAPQGPRLLGGDGRVLDADRDLLGPGRQGEGALDEEDAVAPHLADARPLAALVGALPGEVADGPVDLVDDVGLALVRRGGEGEVGVAAGVEEEGDLLVDAAAPAVGAGVGEAPVAVDEGVALAPVRIAGEVPVRSEVVQGLEEVAAQGGGGVAVVVEVDLDLADALPGEAGEGLEPVGLVLLAGEEERVARAAAVGVAELGGEPRILLGPEAHAGVGLRRFDQLPAGLPVIAEGEEEVPRAVHARRVSPRQHVAGVPLDPGVEALRAKVTDDGVHDGLPYTTCGPAPGSLC